MFDLEVEVRRWRERRERQSSLSPRELDELEDHLRARVDLEMEINRVLAPERAFAIARRELGNPAALEKEFAKAGKPRWRRWLLAGWAVFAASFVLPVVPDWPASEWVPGWGAAMTTLGFLILEPREAVVGFPLYAVSGLTNFLMLGHAAGAARHAATPDSLAGRACRRRRGAQPPMVARVGGTGRVSSAGHGDRLLGLDCVLLLRRHGPVDARQGAEAGQTAAVGGSIACFARGLVSSYGAAPSTQTASSSIIRANRPPLRLMRSHSLTV